jgi:hypothetical protein
MIHNLCHSITHHDSHPRGCESWCVMLCLWLWIMVCYDQPVLVNHGVLCWASGYVSWCAMLRQWFWIMVCYSGPVVVNNGVFTTTRSFITHHDSQPLAQHNTPWFTTTGSALHTMISNHWLIIAPHNSQPLAHYVILSQWLWIMVWYAEPVFVNQCALYWAKGCESWCVKLSQWLLITDCYAVPKVHHDSQPLAQHNTPWLITTGSA